MNFLKITEWQAYYKLKGKTKFTDLEKATLSLLFNMPEEILFSKQ